MACHELNQRWLAFDGKVGEEEEKRWGTIGCAMSLLETSGHTMRVVYVVAQPEVVSAKRTEEQSLTMVSVLSSEDIISMSR